MSAKNKTLPIKIITIVLHSVFSFFGTTLFFDAVIIVSSSISAKFNGVNIYYRTSSFLDLDDLPLFFFSTGALSSSSLTSELIEIMSETSSP